MANEQEQDQQPKPQRDYVKVFGPDNRYYRFPKGTTKDQAISFFKTKGITSPESPAPKKAAITPAAGTPPAGVPPPGPAGARPSRDPNLEKLQRDVGWQAAQKFREMRPRWDDPKQILQDPTWYGRSLRYLGGELLGTTQAGVGVVTGGWKLLNDIASLLNPFEQEVSVGEKASIVGKEVGGAAVAGGEAVQDVGKIAWDLLRHHPELHADPQHLGETIANAAMIVDGTVKGAKSMAEMVKADPLEAMRVANRANTGVPSRFWKRKAFEDQYIHAKGLDIAKKVDKATKAISDEAGTHASNIASQIDTAIPSGVVDAFGNAQTALKTLKDVVKTSDKPHPVLTQITSDIEAQMVGPGLWSWDKARQLRSNVGRVINKVSGPQSVALAKVYKDLTEKLSSSATKYGLGESWKHYNELESKMSHQFADLADDIKYSQSGREVAQKLNKDRALTQEFSKNLGKYGLDPTEVGKFSTDSTRIMKEQSGWKGTLFRQALGSPVGIPVYIAARMAMGGMGLPMGASWIASLVPAAMAGAGFAHIMNLARAAKLSPEVIEDILSQRELPGRMERQRGTFPEGEPPTPTPPTEPPALPPPGMPPAPTPSAPPEPVKALPEAVGREPGAKPGTTRVSGIGRQTQARERVAKARAEKGSTAAGGGTKEVSGGDVARQIQEHKEAEAKASSKDFSVANLQIPDMEDALRRMEPEVFKALQKARKLKKFDEVDYEPYLREMVIRAYEKQAEREATPPKEEL